MLRSRNWRDKVSDDGSDGSHVDVTEPMYGVDFDHDSRRVTMEELVIDTENELVVPCWVGVALGVDTGRELAFLMDPSHRVGSHFATTNGFQVLGRYHVDF